MIKAEVLIEDPNLEYELNEEDVVEYAKQIGIDVQNEKHLMWIAEEGLRANVPHPWLILSDAKGRIFYSNIETGEKSWFHPLDAEYSALVTKERQKNTNSPLSCGYDSKLSSLSDAPPLSLSGKNTPPPLKNTSAISEKKRDLGHFENRRGTKLAPVKLSSLKMPVSSSAATQKTSSTMSFMPKGAALSRNIRRTNDEPELARSQFSARPQIGLPQEDLNESFNSDDGSKYSYEETEDDMERSYDDMNPSDVGSQFSPPLSAVGSPDALDINSLVQLGTKLPQRFESAKKTHHLQSLKEEEPPSLNLRKSGQLSVLKPLQQQTTKKTVAKTGKKKNASSLGSKYEQHAVEEELDAKIAALNEEQRLRFESIQREWAAMQEELVRDEKVKYDKMVIESNKRLEEDELLMKKENSEKLSKMKGELEKKIEEEENSVQATLDDMKKANEQKYADEEKEFNNNLKALSQTMQQEIEKMELENLDNIKKKKEQLDAELKSEIDKMTSSQKDSLKKIEESHAAEMAKLEKEHKEKMEEIQTAFKNEENKANDMMKGDSATKSEGPSIELQQLEELLAKERAEHEELQNKLKDLQEKIATEKQALAELTEKTATAQASFEEVQDEVDKTENDLDLLRTEKSALITELNILKENIKHEKSNLLKEKNMGMSPHKKPDALHKGVNTSLIHSVASQAIQTHVEIRDSSCQMEEIEVSTMEKHSQTHDQKARTFDISCQVDLMQKAASNESRNVSMSNDESVGAYVKNKDLAEVRIKNGMENEHVDVFVNKALENAMMGISNKMEARFKLIEERLGSLDKNVDSPNTKSQFLDAQNNIFPTEMKSHSQAINQNKESHYFSNRPHQNEISHLNEVHSIQNKCSCQKGDIGSCDVMQDVKSSIYRLNDILSTSFVPSLASTVISSLNFPANNHSSPLQSFYSQFRQLQERHRVTELRHKLQGESSKESSNSLKPTGNSYIRDFIGAESLQFNRAINSSPFSSANDDPLNRARNLVLREQARSWKQQQQFLSTSDQQGFIPLERNRNLSISDISPSRTSSGLSEQLPPLQYPFLKFEPDPESEYDEWMSRLKILQDKIRSHKLL